MERNLANEYTSILLKVTSERNERVESFAKTCPEYQAMRQQYSRLCTLAANAALEQDGFEQADAARKAYAKDMQTKQADLLKQNGLPLDYLDVHYVCDICKDTGYVGEAQRRLCECVKRKLDSDKQKKLASMHGFEDFDEGIFPEPEQRDTAIKLKNNLQKYAQAFPNNDKPFIFLQSVVGLGKTFLIGCTAKMIAQRGFSVKFLTAYELGELFRQQHMGGPKHTQALSKVDFLVIDDLGLEPMFRNITVEYLFMVLNERNRNKKHTAFSTNLSRKELQEKYGERILSRLMDKELGKYYMLKGKDLRLQKN